MPLGVLLALAGINVLWAGSSVAAKIALGGIPPLSLAFFRFSIAAVLMYLTATALKVDLRVARRDWGRFWAMGLLGLACTYVLTYIGIRYTMASHAALLIATEPVFLTILSVLVLRETMPPFKIGAIALGLAGVYFIVCNGWKPMGMSSRLFGDGLITLALIFESMASIVGKHLVTKYPAVAVITYEMTIGALVLAPLSAWELFSKAGHGHIALTHASLWALAYLIVPCTVISYTVWYKLLEGRDAGEMSVSLYVQPVAGAILGWYFLGDHISGFTIAGTALVFGALFVLTAAGVRAMPVPPPSD